MSSRFRQGHLKPMEVKTYVAQGIDACYEKLASYIVLMACRDYVRVKQGLGLFGVSWENRQEVADDAKQFLLSDRLSMFTAADGKKILEQLDNVKQYRQWNMWTKEEH